MSPSGHLLPSCHFGVTTGLPQIAAVTRTFLVGWVGPIAEVYLTIKLRGTCDRIVERVTSTNAVTSAERDRLAGKKKPKENSIGGLRGRATIPRPDASWKVNGSTMVTPSLRAVI